MTTRLALAAFLSTCFCLPLSACSTAATKGTAPTDIAPVGADASADDTLLADTVAAEVLADAAPVDSGPVAGKDATLTPFDKTHIYFTGSDNKRSVDAAASFPAEGAYAQILLHLELSCPDGGCDPWDRLGSLGIVTAKGEAGAADTVVEIVRFVTPYHVGAAWDLDLTDLRPLLSGDLTLRAFIDTWVGPGSSYGGGWALTARFDLKGGIPEHEAIAVLPLWNPTGVTYGDPSKPIAVSAAPVHKSLPAASSYAVRALITGHGQGNAGNCAEFCGKTHTIVAGSTPHSQKVWRTDCATTAAPNQQGTYKFSRAGWCPGADVVPWIVDVTGDLTSTADATFAYDVEAYDNTCRPDASPCAGCSLGTGCAYDGGNHTEPYYQLSALLIAYR